MPRAPLSASPGVPHTYGTIAAAIVAAAFAGTRRPRGTGGIRWATCP